MKLCSVASCHNKVFGKHFCKFHYPKSLTKSPFKSGGLFSKFGSKIKNDIAEFIDRDKRKELFETVWRKRIHYSEVSHTFLGDTPNSMFFHHILPKRNHKEAEFDEENIILMTPEEHANVESNIYRYPVINKRREILKKKYNIM